MSQTQILRKQLDPHRRRHLAPRRPALIDRRSLSLALVAAAGTLLVTFDQLAAALHGERGTEIFVRVAVTLALLASVAAVASRRT